MMMCVQDMGELPAAPVELVHHRSRIRRIDDTDRTLARIAHEIDLIVAARGDLDDFEDGHGAGFRRFKFDTLKVPIDRVGNIYRLTIQAQNNL